MITAQQHLLSRRMQIFSFRIINFSRTNNFLFEIFPIWKFISFVKEGICFEQLVVVWEGGEKERKRVSERDSETGLLNGDLNKERKLKIFSKRREGIQKVHTYECVLFSYLPLPSTLLSRKNSFKYSTFLVRWIMNAF